MPMAIYRHGISYGLIGGQMNLQNQLTSKFRAWSRISTRNSSVTVQIAGSKALADMRSGAITLPEGDLSDPQYVDLLEGLLEHEIGHLIETDINIVQKSSKAGGLTKWLTNLFEDPRMENERIRKTYVAKEALDKLEDLAIEFGFFGTQNVDLPIEIIFHNWLLNWVRGNIRSQQKLLSIANAEEYLLADLAPTIERIKALILDNVPVSCADTLSLSEQLIAILNDQLVLSDSSEEKAAIEAILKCKERPKDLHDKLKQTVNSKAEDARESGDVIAGLDAPVEVKQMKLTGSLDFGSVSDTSALIAKLVSPVKCREVPSDVGVRLHRNRYAQIVAGDTSVFSKRVPIRKRTPTAISFLVDRSGSMNDLMPSVNGTLFGIVKGLSLANHINTEVLYYPMLTRPIDPKSDKYTWGIHQAKKFDGQALEADFKVSADGTTPTGEAIFGAVADLIKRPEQRKLLFVLTDGYPDSNSPIEEALLFAKTSGITTIAVGLQTTFVAGFNRFITVDQVSDISTAISREIDSYLI